LLPIENEKNIVSLNEGFTPVIQISKLGEIIGLKNLYLKDEGMLPTGTFKARGATVGVSMAKELGITTVAIPTVGNAGEAWAAYCAKAGIKLHVVMPKDALEINKRECLSLGAELYLLDGLLSDASKIVSQWAKERKWFSAATLFEPYRIEGKKTMGFEIAEQFNWNLPDVIIHPCGGAVGIISIWKALKELQMLGWVDRIQTRIVAVQSTGCAPIVKAFENGKSESEFWHGAKSMAQGFLAPNPAGDHLCLDTIRQSNGTAISVSDEEIKNYIDMIAAVEGISACPEGVGTICAAKRLKDRGWIKPEEKVLLVNTGSGMKYFHLLSIQKIPHKIDADMRVTK
jgi:threonine synthase